MSAVMQHRDNFVSAAPSVSVCVLGSSHHVHFLLLLLLFEVQTNGRWVTGPLEGAQHPSASEGRGDKSTQKDRGNTKYKRKERREEYADNC